MSSLRTRTTRCLLVSAACAGKLRRASERRTEMARIVLAGVVHLLGSPAQIACCVTQIHAPESSHRLPTVSALCPGEHGGSETCGTVVTNEWGCYIGRSVLDRPANHRAPARTAVGGHGDVSIHYSTKYNQTSSRRRMTYNNLELSDIGGVLQRLFVLSSDVYAGVCRGMYRRTYIMLLRRREPFTPEGKGRVFF